MNRRGELITLPLALESPYGLAVAFRRRSTCSLDRIGGGTELMRGDMGNHPGLAGSVGGKPCCSTQVSGCAHGMAARRASLHQFRFATHPSTGVLDGLTWSRVFRPSRLEQVQNVLRA